MSDLTIVFDPFWLFMWSALFFLGGAYWQQNRRDD